MKIEKQINYHIKLNREELQLLKDAINSLLANVNDEPDSWLDMRLIIEEALNA